MGASLAEAFLPARPPVRSFGCFPCLHSKRRLAKKICTSVAAGGALPGRTVPFGTLPGNGRVPRCLPRAELLCKSSYAMQAWKAVERERKKEAEARRLPRPRSPGHTSHRARPLLLIPSSASYIFHLLSLSRFPSTSHPKCCHRQRHASFHPPLSRNFIGLAGSGWPRLLSHG